VLVGCKPQQPFYLGEKGDLSHYVGLATKIEYPDDKDQPPSEVEGAIAPFTLSNTQPKEIWNLKLEDAIRYALQNTKVMKSLGSSVISANMPLQDVPPTALTSGGPVNTIYDPAIAETDARFGVEAALSLFDAQWNTDIFWEKNHDPRDPFSDAALQQFFPQIFLQDTAQFQTSLSKTTATGAQLSVANTTVYDLENTARLFPADWTTNFQVQIRQPLLQGGGVDYNRIAGPGAIPGFNQGVVLARLNTDIALASFEAGVRNMLVDVETAYWELYAAYRSLDAAVTGRDAALQIWQRTYALFTVGAVGGEKATESQARAEYFKFRAAAEEALARLYQIESKLRYMMGLAATDGRLIRPADEPTTARVTFEWAQTHAEALCRSVEIREQKWRVKQREMELIAAKDYLLPRLDAVAKYTWQGLGQNLIAFDGGTNFAGAFENLGTNQFQDWHLELQMQVPIGFRKQLAGVRNAELALARERAKLQDTELEVSHQVAYALRDLDANLVETQTNFNRRVAAQRNVEAIRAAYDNGKIAIDVLLGAEEQRAEAENAYYRALVNYVRAISQVHFRKGSLLEYNGVYLAEGPWPGKAYFDARRRARARDAAHYINYGITLPSLVSRGALVQRAGDSLAAEETPSVPAAAAGKPAEEPLPAATPGKPAEEAPAATPGKPAEEAPAAAPGKPAEEGSPPVLPAPASAAPAAQTPASPSQELGQWTRTKPNQGQPSGEPPAIAPPADADPPASGWQGIQH
jgi:outer membrane protein TolC